MIIDQILAYYISIRTPSTFYDGVVPKSMLAF